MRILLFAALICAAWGQMGEADLMEEADWSWVSVSVTLPPRPSQSGSQNASSFISPSPLVSSRPSISPSPSHSPTVSSSGSQNVSSLPPSVSSSGSKNASSFISPSPSISSHPSISSLPSISPSPSLSPSVSSRPSVSPRPSVSAAPSDSPSVSLQPSVSAPPSMQPSVSMSPSQPGERESSSVPSSGQTSPDGNPTNPSSPGGTPTNPSPGGTPTNPSPGGTPASPAPPVGNPTRRPTNSPTRRPTNSPTRRPTNSPTRRPTNTPTRNPTRSPTRKPTNSPTRAATPAPTPPPTPNPLSACRLCVLSEDTGNPTRAVPAFDGAITTCQNLDAIIQSSLDPPDCGGYGGVIGEFDVSTYCGCPSSVPPRQCSGLCDVGAAVIFPDLVVDLLTCWEWDELVMSSVDSGSCGGDLTTQIESCCELPATDPPTEPPTDFPTPFPTIVTDLPTDFPTPFPTPSDTDFGTDQGFRMLSENAIGCDLCPNGSSVGAPNKIVMGSRGDFISCMELEVLYHLYTEFENDCFAFVEYIIHLNTFDPAIHCECPGVM